MSRLGDLMVMANFTPVSDPRTAEAAWKFYEALVAGTAVQRIDKTAPPLAIELEKGER